MRNTTLYCFEMKLIKLLLIAALCVFFGMTYWSSLLIEKDLKTLRSEISQLKKEIHTLRYTSRVVRNERTQSQQRSLIDSSYPSLLSEDPFYATTLPKMLGADFIPHGTFHDETISKPKSLHPFNGWAPASGWIGDSTDNLAHFHFGK